MKMNLHKRLFYSASLLFICIAIAACKASDESFNFAGEADSNDQQGAASITSFSPTAATNIMCSSPGIRCGTSPFLTNGSSQSFSVSITGAAPIAYVWKLNGTVISGATASLYTMNASPSTVGAGTYSLAVTASNDQGSSTHTFTVKVNEPPSLSSPNPTNDETLGLNYSSVKSFDISGTDANSDAITYVWQLDGSSVARLTGSAIAGGSQGVYSPILGDLGAKTVKVLLRDAHYAESGAGKYEPEEYSWPMNINYLSDDCNDLVAGAICTVVGRPGIVTDTDAPVNGTYSATTEPVKVRPNYILDDGAGNLFISDSASHVIWFHNRKTGPSPANDVTVLGKTVLPGKIIALVGNGSGGISPDNNASYTYNNYKLNGPQMMSYDSVADALYVADFYNNRVARINSTGQGATVFGNITTTANNTTTNGSSAVEIPATNAACYYPVGLVVNAAKTKMYVACSRSHVIKYVNMTDPDPANWTSSIAVGRVTNAGAIQTSGIDNNVVGGGDWLATPLTARAYYPWTLALDLNENLYWTQNGGNGTYSGHIHVLKVAATPSSYFGGAVPAATTGRVYTVAAGNGNNPSTLTKVSYLAAAISDGRGLAILEPSAGNITGFFVSSSLRSIILFLNNSDATQTFGNNAISSPAEAVTGNSGTDVISHAGHTFVANEPIYFESLTGGTGLTVGTTYYVRTIVAGVSYQLSTSSGGGAFNFTTNITGAMIKRPNVGLIWGVYSLLGGAYTGEVAPAANSNRLNNPTGLTLIGSDLFVADTNNFRVRKLDLSTGNGATATVTGGVDIKTGNSADSVTPSPDFRGYFLEQMIFDASKNKIYFADNGAAPTPWNTGEIPRTPDIENHRIRRFDPVLGTVDTLVGRGWGDTSPMNEPANTALIQGVKGMALMPDGNILFADRHLFSNGTNRSCMVRAYNSTATNKTYFSAAANNVLAGNVATLAGNYALGCANFTGTGPATSASMYYPEGIATDGSSLYIASYQQHCILKVDNTGTISSYIGLCGTANDVNGGFGTARLRYPTQLMSDPRYPTNFFVVDQTDQPATSIKYVNLSGANVSVVGSTITDQQIQSLTGLTSGGYTQALTTYTPTPTAVTGAAVNDTIFHAGHEFANNDTVNFHSLTGGAGLFINTRYYVKNVVAGVSYKLGTSAGSATTIDITSDVTAGTIARDNDLICYTSGALGNGGLGSHNVTCRERRAGNLSIRIGEADGSLVKGGSQMDAEEEGDIWNPGSSSLDVKLSGPAGLTFDSEGNLYITERDSAVIRKVKKWW